MNDVLQEVAPLLSRAKVVRDRGALDAALRPLQQAITSLETALQAIEGRGPDLPEDLRADRQEIARKLADCYGMQGGIYRRKLQWEQCLDSYRRGCAIEQGPRYGIEHNPKDGIVDSYNLTNTLVISLFLDPEHLHVSREAIAAAAETVASQIRLKRHSQWWAWADLGLLSLLSGQPEQARTAYEQFQRTGARASDHDSTIAVLEECRQKLISVAPEVAGALAGALDYLRSTRPQE